jgi:hypothetical protein
MIYEVTAIRAKLSSTFKKRCLIPLRLNYSVIEMRSLQTRDFVSTLTGPATSTT